MKILKAISFSLRKYALHIGLFQFAILAVTIAYSGLVFEERMNW